MYQIHFLLDDSSDEEIEQQPKIRHFRDLSNPLEGFSDKQIYERYRFTAQVIMELTDMLKEDIERPTRRNRAIPALHQTCIMLR